MPKKPVLVTLEEFEEAKLQLQGRIDGVLRELRTKVPGCEDRIAELQVAKGELARNVEIAITATKRVADDSQAATAAMVGELDTRLSAKVADLLAQLQHSDEALTRDLTTSEGETRKLVADELTALCERLDQELSSVRREMAESTERCAGDARAELQKMSASLSASIAASRQQSLDHTSELVKACRAHVDDSLYREQKARTVEEDRVKVAEADIWLKLDRLTELVQEVGDAALEEVRATTGEMDHKFTEALTLADQRLTVLDDSCLRLQEGLCEVQNNYTRKVTWVLRKASEKLRPPLLDDVKIQPHVSWFSPLFDAGGCHGLQLELQIFRAVDPPLEGQEVGDCAVYLWATRGCNLVYKLAVGSKSQLLEKRFNGRVPYGTTRLCFFTDQINREDDTLRVSCEILEAFRELESPVEPAAPHPPDWRKALLAEGKPVPEVDAVVAACRDHSGPEPLEGQLLYYMHINNRLLDLVKDQVDAMRCRMVRTVEWRIENASLLRLCFPEGEALCSPDFGAAGIEGLRLVFYPCGYLGATEGFCSLFLVAPAGAMLQCTLQAGRERREASHAFEREGAFGRTNFCQLQSCVDEHDCILVRLDVAEAHQDLVAKAAHPPPKPGDQRTLSQREGAVPAPVQSAVKLRRHVANYLEDVKVLPSLWMPKTADDPSLRPQGYLDFNELRDRARLQEAAQPVRGMHSPVAAIALAKDVRAPVTRVEVGPGDENLRRRPKSGLPSGRSAARLSESQPNLKDPILSLKAACAAEDRLWLQEIPPIERPKSAGIPGRRRKPLHL